MQNELNKTDEYKKEFIDVKSKSNFKGLSSITFVQIVLCISIICMFLLLKVINVNLFNKLKCWYNLKLNESIIEIGNINDYKEVFNSVISDKIEKYNDKIITNGLSTDKVMLSTQITPPIKEGTITSNFGEREDPFTFEKKIHYGVDIAADEGKPICAVMSGKVACIGEDEFYGKYILLDHGNDIKSLYAHCSEIIEKCEGDSIIKGEDIAYVGSTGKSTGNHLHLEIIIGDTSYDPKPLLKGAYL